MTLERVGADIDLSAAPLTDKADQEVVSQVIDAVKAFNKDAGKISLTLSVVYHGVLA